MPPLLAPFGVRIPWCQAQVAAGILILGSLVAISGVAHAAPAGLTAAPLAPRSGPRGITLFTDIPPAVSGLKAANTYDDPRMWSTRYHEFSVGAIGTGVACADYDADGRPDLFVVSKTETGRLFRNLGGFRFEDVTALARVGDASGEWKQGAAFADVDNDGRPDLYVCRFAAPNLLFMNRGDGTFREEAAPRGLAVVDASSMAAFCDYDRDGWLDVYLQTNLLDAAAHPDGQRDYLFRNDGTGHFTDVTDRAGIKGLTQGHSATWWDYNNDGWPDLHVANDFAAADTLYRNNRDGTFTDVLATVVPHTTFSSMGADLGDVDNDGRLDLFIADMATTTRAKDLRGMADSRTRLRDPDDASSAAPQYSRNVLLLNTGTGRCLEAAQLAGLGATDWTWSPRFEDLDNDGRLDLHIPNGMNREQTNTDLLDRMMLAENPAERVRLMRASPLLAEPNLAFRNLGDLRFESVGPAWGLDQKGVSFGSAFADVDGDGDLDLVYVNYQGPPTLLRNDGDSGHSVVIHLRGTRSNRFGVGALVRLETASGPQVRQLVLARGYESTSEPLLHFGLGAETRLRKLGITWPDGGYQEFTDIPADQRLTITEPPGPPAPAPALPAPTPQFTEASVRAGLSWSSEEVRGDQTLAQPLLPLRFNRRGPALAAADVDGDGRDDLVLGGTTRTPLRLLRAGAASSFSSTTIPRPPAAIPVNDGPILVFDTDADGHEDLLLAKGGAALPEGSPSYQPELLLGDGRGGFTPAPAGALPPLAFTTGAIAAVDFNRDGRLDVFVGGRLAPGHYPKPARSALLLNRGDRFEDVTDSLAPGLRQAGLVCSALWSDVDGDGWSDLLLALEWGGVQYWHNNAGGGFTNRSTEAGFAAAGTGWWTSLASADFNRDGRPDFVAGNQGLNTPYTASPVAPALLFAGDFKGGGSTQLVEAAYEDGVLHPLRTRKELGAKIPSVLKRFPKTDLFAAASLGEILGDDKLAAATRYAATELRHGVFLSRADGRYDFGPLPRLAQIAPVQGLVATDLDGDGHADIALVHNSYAPIPYIGRFDGGLGLWLRGDGRGGFTAVPALESGLVVPGDAKALVVADVDGDDLPDLVVSRNASTTLAFLNRRSAGSNPLSVVLRGKPGNQRAAGARLTLELANGTRQTAEVQLGGGYASQSAGAVHFGFTDGNPPRLLTIRWPDGSTTSRPVPACPRRLDVPQE